MTEVSNLCSFGVKEPLRSRISQTLAHVAAVASERYSASAVVTRMPEYGRLGLADAAWLAALGRDSTLISDDMVLCATVLASGLQALDFDQLRNELG